MARAVPCLTTRFISRFFRRSVVTLSWMLGSVAAITWGQVHRAPAAVPTLSSQDGPSEKTHEKTNNSFQTICAHIQDFAKTYNDQADIQAMAKDFCEDHLPQSMRRQSMARLKELDARLQGLSDSGAQFKKPGVPSPAELLAEVRNPTVQVQSTALRQKPGALGAVKKTLSYQDRVQILEYEASGWVKVRLTDGTEGYVQGSSLYRAPTQLNPGCAPVRPHASGAEVVCAGKG